MEIPFTGDYDQPTLQRAVLLSARPARWWTLIRWGLLVAAVLLNAYLLYQVFSKPNPSALEWGRVAQAVLSLLTTIGLVGSPYWQARQIAQKLWQAPGIRARQVGAISAQGIRFGADRAIGLLAWERFAHLRKTGDLVVLVTADGTMAALPRRFFADEEAWRRFQQWAEHKVVVPR